MNEISDTEILDWLGRTPYNAYINIEFGLPVTFEMWSDEGLIYSHEGGTLRESVTAAIREDREYRAAVLGGAET